jgi:hypothetical protein
LKFATLTIKEYKLKDNSVGQKQNVSNEESQPSEIAQGVCGLFKIAIPALM